MSEQEYLAIYERIAAEPKEIQEKLKSVVRSSFLMPRLYDLIDAMIEDRLSRAANKPGESA